MIAFSGIVPNPASNIRCEELDQSEWDVVILGAGIAGACTAILCAKHGLKTLVLESKSFPREKVCGGCLNRAAQSVLERIGILPHLIAAGAVPIEALHLQILKSGVRWPVPKMLSIRRSTLDSLLVSHAMELGCSYIDRSTGTLVPRDREAGVIPKGEQIEKDSYRAVRVQSTDGASVVRSRCVVVASGLTRSSLRNDRVWPAEVSAESRIGVQCILPNGCAPEYADGQLHMMVGRNGYAGICSTDGETIDIAAAIDPASIQPMGGIDSVVRSILADCAATGIDWPTDCTWLATPALTRSSMRVADDRVFLIGDAIGYLEPFTGQGMSWALASVEAVMPLVQEVAQGKWKEEIATRWNDWAYRQRIHHQRTCRWIANRIRQPHSAAWVLQACNWIPPLRATIIRKSTQ
jgi:flavin-dependent dehydrogenase